MRTAGWAGRLASGDLEAPVPVPPMAPGLGQWADARLLPELHLSTLAPFFQVNSAVKGLALDLFCHINHHRFILCS